MPLTVGDKPAGDKLGPPDLVSPWIMIKDEKDCILLRFELTD
jgi:hypothetical protein